MHARIVRLFPAVSAAAIVGIVGVALSLSPSVTAQPEKPAEKPAGQPGGGPPPPPGGGGGQRREGGPGRGEGAGSVDGAMKGMNRALRQLSGQIGDAAKKDDNLKLINAMQRSCVNAKDLAAAEGVQKHAKDEDQKAKLTETYRKNLISVMRKLLDLEEAVAAGKTDDAKAKLAEVAKLKDSGHADMGLE